MTENITQSLVRQIKFKKEDLKKAEIRIKELTHATALAIITVIVKKAELKVLEAELVKASLSQIGEKK